VPGVAGAYVADEPGEYRCRVVRRGSDYLGIEVIGYKGPQKAETKSARHADPNAALRARLAERFPHLTKA